MVAPLYQSIGAVTGARVIIDSSKRPPDAALLRLVPGLDVYVVHLVRDPRAVAYSWRRTRGQPDPNGPVRLARHGTIHSTSRWVYRNAAAEAVMRAVPSDRVLRLRYESFVACPAQTVRSIMRFVGEDGPGPTFSDERTIELGINHTVSGNPSRFRPVPFESRTTGNGESANDDDTASWPRPSRSLSSRDMDTRCGRTLPVNDVPETGVTPKEDAAGIVGIARGGGLNVLGSAFNQLLRFAITYVLARVLGRSQAGLYFQAYAILSLLGILASFGFTQSLTRFVALYRAEEDGAAVRGVVRLALLIAAGTAALLGAALFAGSPYIAREIFHEPRLILLLRSSRSPSPRPSSRIAHSQPPKGSRRCAHTRGSTSSSSRR